MRAQGRRRLSRRGLAVTVSLLAHALLAVLLDSRPPRSPAPSTTRSAAPITFELDEPPGAPAPAPAPSPRTRVSAASRPRVRAAPAPAPRAQAEPPADEGAPLPQTRGAESGAAEPGSPAIDLSLGALGAETRARIAGPAPEATLEAKPRGRPSLDELRVVAERAEDAAANVARGRVDPVLYDYLRGARARFHDEARKVAEAIPLGAGATVRSWGRGYAAKVEEWQRGQASAPPDAVGDRPPADILSGYGHTVSAARAGAEVRSVELCLDVEGGHASAPVLRRGSGVPALDRIALDAFSRAVAARPAPPDLRAGLACYELRVSAHRMPPVPMLSCSFDIGSASSVSCAWPFKRITNVTGRLVSVDYERSDPRTAKPSLLRRPR